jgi:hypothetical protein
VALVGARMFRDITRGSIMQTTAAIEDVHRNAEYFEYSKAADPIGLKIISRVPYHNFPASLYKDGPTRVVTLDLSKELGVDYPATGPGLLAHFVRVVRGSAGTGRSPIRCGSTGSPASLS